MLTGTHTQPPASAWLPPQPSQMPVFQGFCICLKHAIRSMEQKVSNGMT
jgi:hypothetical protein